MGEYVIKQRVENGKSRELGRPVSAFSTAFSTGFSFCPDVLLNIAWGLLSRLRARATAGTYWTVTRLGPPSARG